jgi:hypothetical protein
LPAAAAALVIMEPGRDVRLQDLLAMVVLEEEQLDLQAHQE